MRIEQIIEAIKNDLDAYADEQEQKVRVSVAGDPLNVLESLITGPAGYMVVLHWAGDQMTGRHQDPKSANQIEVVVGYNLGLRMPLEEAIWKTTEKRPSLLKLVGDVRSWLLTLQFPEDETDQFFTYQGTETVVTPSGIPLAAYRIRVSIDAICQTETEYRDADYTADPEPDPEA